MKKLKFAVAVLIAVIGLAASARAQDLSAQYMQAGNTVYSQKNYDLAIRYYQGVVQINPNYWQAYQGMGNSYYGKGDTANALTNYQKALAINPNNPQLASFVQSLQASAPAPGPASNPSSSPAPASRPMNSASAAAKTFEIDPMAGIAISTSGGYSVGFGGGVAGYFPAGGGLFLGGSLGFYTFSASSSSVDEVPPYGSITSGTSSNWTNIEILASGKYRLEGGNGLTPYLLGGAGLSLFGVSSTSSTTYNFNPPYNTPEYEDEFPNTTTSVPGSSSIYPTIQVGGGAEISLGPDMNAFGEAKYTLIIGQGGTAGYIPVEVGLNIKI